MTDRPIKKEYKSARDFWRNKCRGLQEENTRLKARIQELEKARTRTFTTPEHEFEDTQND